MHIAPCRNVDFRLTKWKSSHVSTAEIIRELPKLTEAERRIIRQKLLELATENEEVRLCDQTALEGAMLLDQLEEEDVLKPGAFHLQQIQTISTVKLERRLGTLTEGEMKTLEEALMRRLAPRLSAMSVAELACLQKRGRIALQQHWRAWSG